MELTLFALKTFIFLIVVLGSVLQLTNGGYIGCFKENIRKRVYNVNPGAIKVGTLTQEKCVTICGFKYTYAALTRGDMCLCGNVAPASADPVLVEEPSKCTVPCVGDGTETCGSVTHVQLYDAIKPVTSTLAVSKKIVQIGEAVTFTPNVVTAGSGYQMRMDYGDGAGLSSYAANPGSSLLTRSFYQAGEYSVGAYLTDSEKALPDTVSKITVLVETPVSGVTINCPTDMATFEPDVCTIDVMAGTDMEVTITYEDGGTSQSTNFSIADAIEFSLGNPVQENILDPLPSLLSGSSTNGLVLHPGNYAQRSGTLLGFEYFAANAGTLNIFVFRPTTSCGGGNEYCGETNSCVPSGTCGVWTCSGDLYCSDIMRCCGDSPLTVSTALFGSYAKVYTKTVTVATGYGYADVKADAFSLIEGDIIAHSAFGGAMLAQFPPVSGEEAMADYYCAGVDGTSASSVTSGSCSLQTEVYQLKAVAAKASSIYFPLEFTSPGSNDFTATVSNRAITGSETQTVTINVVEGVDQAILDVDGCIAADEVYTFALKPFTGGSVNIDWDFGDGNTDVETGVSATSQTHTYTTTGTFLVTYNISNIISFKANQTEVCVQERITGLDITFPLSYVEVNVEAALNLGMITGSDYTCTLSFNDHVVTIDEASVPANSNFMYNFTSSGAYTVNAECSNGIGSDTDTLSTTALERITGLALDPPGAMADTDFIIKVIWTTGSDLNLTLTYDSLPIAMTINAASRFALSGVMTGGPTGKHPVSVTVANIISTEVLNIDFTIEIAITNHLISCNFLSEITLSQPQSEVVIPTNSDVECHISMDDGTSVALTIVWGDASGDYTHLVADGDPWSSNPAPDPISHSFVTPETCYMSVTIANAYSSFQMDYVVMVMTSVDNVEINPVAPAEFTPPATFVFTFSVTSGPQPNGVTCEMSWGDLHTDVYEDFDLSQPLTHIYRDMPGELTLTYTCSNIVSSKTGTTPVTIVTPIRNMTVFTNPSAAVVNVPLDLVFMARRAPGAGILDLTFYCDESAGSTVGPRKRTENSPDGQDVESCTYTSTGTFTARVMAVSYFETVNATYDVIVQNPVTQEFTVTTNAPMDYPANDCQMTYTMTFTGATLPDDPYVEFDYGDGTTSGELPFTNPLNHNYHYAGCGHYTTTIRFFNLASQVERKIQSGCYEDFANVAMTVLREQFLPLNGPDQPGYGTNQNIFRVDEAIKLHVSMTAGTFVYYAITVESATDIITANSTDKDVARLFVNVNGTFTISLVAKNPLYQSDPVTFEAVLMEPATDIIVSDNDIVTKANEFKTFEISFGVIGDEMCLLVDNGIDSEFYLYGDETECQSDSILWASGRYFPSVITNPFIVTYKYTQETTYYMTVTAYNTHWSTSTQFRFAVAAIDCTSPNIGIKDHHPFFNYPLWVKKSHRNRFVGVTDIACPDTLINIKSWTVDRWDGINDVSLGSVDVSSVPSAVNSELSIPALLLDYGLYNLHYKVCMVSDVKGEGFCGESTTFVQVDASDLVVQVFDGGVTLVTKGPSVEMTLAPRDYSYDPDDPTSDFDSFAMKCRDFTAGEAYPDPDVYFTVEDLAAVPVDNGGCFRKGPGYVQSFSGRLTFNTNLMKPGHVYEIVVYGYKDTRESSATVFLEILTGNPPEQTISFKIPNICAPAANGKLFNPNTQLGLISVTNCPTCSYTYLWEVYAYDTEYEEVSQGWRLLSYLMDFIEGTAGIESDELTIHTSLFSHYKTVETLQVRLMVTDTTTGITGKTYQNLVRNHPPRGGNCTIDPATGTAGMTNHTIECSGFYDDENEIEDYRILCETSNDSYIIASGLQPSWNNRQLPVGLEGDGFILTCSVMVFDDLGASETYFVQHVTSNLMSRDDMKNAFAGMVGDNADKTEFLKATGNRDEVTNFGFALGTLFSVMSKDAEQEYVDQPVALHAEATGFGNTSPRPGAFQTEVTDTDVLLRYEDERNNIVQVVNTLSDAFAACTIESPKDMEISSNSIAAVVSSPDHIARDAQAGFVNLLGGMVDKLDDNWEELTVEGFRGIATGIVSALGKIDEATELHKDNPSNTDLEKEAENVIEFDSNMDSPIDDVGFHADPRDVLREGKKIYNKRTQQAFANVEVSKRQKILDKMTRILSKVKPKSPDPFVIKSSGMEMKLTKNSAKDLVNKEVETSGGKVELPALSALFPNDDPSLENETMVFEAVAKVKPPSPEFSGGQVSPFSNCVSFSFRDKDGNKKKVKNLASPIPITIKQDVNKPPDALATEFANPEIVATRENEFLFYHKVIKPQLPIWPSIHLTFRPTNVTGNQLLVLISHNEKPDPEKGIIKHVCMIPSHTDYTGFYGDAVTPDPYTCFIDADLVAGEDGSWEIGIRQMDPLEFNLYTNVESLPKTVPDSWKKNKLFSQNYKLDSFLASCASTDDDSASWTTDGCKPGPLTTSSSIQCLCTHFTTFAGGWVVAPNTIDWNFVFSNADFFKNPTLYITEIVIAVVYILAMIWARRQDKHDVEKLGLAPLPDNNPRDKYYYEIYVSTGMRRNAGTESKVHFILSGEEEETDVRTFADNKRKIFCRGNLDGFLMAVPSDLGHLMYLRIWHDNSGKSKAASWYLGHIIIRDIQTDKKYFFIANRWFAVEEDDGQVDRVIPVAGKEQMSEFSHLFRERASKNLSDGHLWFSVVARPPQSRFTRCQRVSCCLCLLFMTMLANAMFYQTASSSANAYTFGPFALTPEQIFIGIASNIIIFPINFLIITIFRKARPRKLRPSRVEEALKAKADRTTSMTDVNPKMKSSLSEERPGSSFLMEPIRTESSLSRPETSLSGVPQTKVHGKKKKCELPWWFRIIGWILLWVAVGVSAAFVTFYGIMFQDIKCKKWITSMLISFFTSVFLTQPIKVFLFAIIFSLIIKNPGGDEDDDDEEECKIAREDELLHKPDEGFSFISPQRALYKPKPPDPKVLEAARQQRLKEIQMWSVIREIVFYAFFLWILMVISYKSVSTESYYYKFSMKQVFILTNDTKHSFTKVKNTNDFWVWARTGMLRGLRAGPYYNNYPPFYMRGYINDKVSRLMGYAILRQVRVRKNTCMLPHDMEGVIPECNDDYDTTIEDDGTYSAGWQPLTNPNDTREEYTYMTGDSLNSYPYWGHIAVYGGGGYIVRLNQAYQDMVDQFTQLEQENWIDKYTRAVFLEFTVYNPSINLFSISTLLSEFQPSGGVTPSYRFEPCMLLPYMSSVLLFQIACEIIYFLFTLWFIIKEIRTLYKERWKYFLHFWNLVELCIIAMSITAIVIYFYRLYSVNQLTEYFKETHGNEYMKFQYVGYWTEIFNYIIGFLVFFASMKFLKLLRFNKRISLLSDTLKNSGRDLIHFSIIFNIVFLAFIQMFYLVYVANLDTFRTFITSCEAGIVMMMGKFDIYNMLAVNQWFTQIFIFLFVVTITFIIVNMFLSILNETFSSVRTDVSKQQNDYEIVDFMMGRFKMWTGLGKAPPTTISPDEMDNERNRNYRTLEGQIDYFPSQIDRFLSSISHMYMERSQFDDFLRKGAYGKMAMKAQMADTARHPQPGPSGVRPRRGSRPRSGRGMTDVQTD